MNGQVLGPKTRAAIGSYFRALLVLFAAVVIGVIFRDLNGKNPLTWTHADLVILGNGVWLALGPVIWRWANRHDLAYGRGSGPLVTPGTAPAPPLDQPSQPVAPAVILVPLAQSDR